MAASDSRPVPRKNTAHRVYFPIYDADGDLVSGATGLDSEVSLDGGNFADCISEAIEIQSTGIYYLDLTVAEMNADCACVQVKTTTAGAKTTVIILYPQETGDIKIDLQSILGTALTETEVGYLAAAFKKLFDVVTPVFTAASVNQTANNPSAADIKIAIEAAGSHLALIKAKTDTIPASPAAVGSAMIVSDKTGFKLSADGLDTISIIQPSGVASNFREMLVQVWRYLFKKKTEDGSNVKTYKDDGSVGTIQAVTESGGVTTVGSAQ